MADDRVWLALGASHPRAILHDRLSGIRPPALRECLQEGFSEARVDHVERVEIMTVE